MVLRTNKTFQSDLLEYERLLLAVLFSKQSKRNLSSYSGELNPKLNKVYRKIYEQMVTDSLLKISPLKLQDWFVKMMLGCVFVAMILFLVSKIYLDETITNISYLCLSLILTSAIFYHGIKVCGVILNLLKFISLHDPRRI